MSHSHSYIDQHVFSYRVVENLGDYLPAVEKGITFDFYHECQQLCDGDLKLELQTYGDGRDIHIRVFPTEKESVPS